MADEATLTAANDAHATAAPPPAALEEKELLRNQFMALIRKNARFQRRKKRENCCQVSVPIFCVLMLVAIQQIVDAFIDNTIEAELEPSAEPPMFITPLGTRTDPLTIFLVEADGVDAGEYGDIDTAPRGLLGDAYHGAMHALHASTIGEDEAEFPDPDKYYEADAQRRHLIGNVTMPRVESKRALDDFMFAQWHEEERFVGAYLFDRVEPAARRYAYTVMLNQTQTNYADWPMFCALAHTAIFRQVGLAATGRAALPGLAALSDLPMPELRVHIDIASLVGVFFYIFVVQSLLGAFTSSLVYEKEHGLRENMRMMGLKMSVYWTSNIAWFATLYLVQMFFLIFSGLAAGFDLFHNNHFLSYFLLYIFWGMCLISMSLALSSVITRYRTASVASYMYIILAGAIGNALVATLMANEEANATTLSVLSIVPTFAMYRGLFYLGQYAGEGMSLRQIGSSGLGGVYGWLLFESVLLLAMAWYIEETRSTIGVSKEWDFFAHRAYWRSLCGCAAPADDAESGARGDAAETRFRGRVPLDKHALEGMPADVRAEAERVHNDDSDAAMVRVVDLRKVYHGRDGNADKVAVETLSFGVQRGECFGLLGANGAGKTTAISVLCGVHRATAGAAYVDGWSVERHMHRIHLGLGVCPQHDVLWGSLTAEEHVTFYARTKGYTGAALADVCRQVLTDMNLWAIRARRVDAMSGGMRRRLSVAIALLGTSVIFMDEMSTGVDPATRRAMWDVLMRYKRDRAILLTTHSMEEAERLCTRVAIMGNGRMHTIGTPEELKARYGEGFRLLVQGDAARETQERIDAFVRELFGEVTLLGAVGGTRDYEVPAHRVNLARVFERMEESKAHVGIVDWGLQNTTLEQVFVEVARGLTRTPQQAAHCGERAE